MRILWLSNAPFVGSGYGEQTGLFVPRLQAQGHELAVACNHGVENARLNWNGLTLYPADYDWGNKSFHTYAAHHDADMVIALLDAWVMRPDEWPDPWSMAIWAPVDHVPLPPRVAKVLNHRKVRPIAMAKHGEQEMRRFGLDPAYVPHGVDTEVFRPQPDLREEARDFLQLPKGGFLVGMVGANKSGPVVSRKAFPQAFDAFGRLARRHDDVYLYVHSQAEPAGNSGQNLKRLAFMTGLPGDRIQFVEDEAWQLGINRELMAMIYQAFDVLLSPSMGEGFGVPIIEAQACGVPVIVSDHSAMTELCGAGWLVDGDRWWDEGHESFFHMPYIASIDKALEAAYRARADQRLRDQAVAFASAYDADTVAETYWKPALEQLAGPREAGPLQVAGAAEANLPKLNRQQKRQLARAR